MFDRVLNTPPYFDICIVLLNTQKQITHLFIFSNQENNFQLKLDRFFNTSVMCLPSIHGGGGGVSFAHSKVTIFMFKENTKKKES